MKFPTRISTVALAAGLLVFAPTSASAQIGGSLTAGVAGAYGDGSDLVGDGYTLRGQLGLDLLLVGLHAQVGYTRFSGTTATVAGNTIETNASNNYHYGIGGRLGAGGLLWFGGTGAWFAGDGDDEFGLIPEVGVGIGPLEVVADARVTGSSKWWSLRGGIRF